MFKLGQNMNRSRGNYSYLRAISGSTRVASRAGKKHAARPTRRMTATTAPYFQGSVTETPEIWLARKRLSMEPELLIPTRGSMPQIS